MGLSIAAIDQMSRVRDVADSWGEGGGSSL